MAGTIESRVTNTGGGSTSPLTTKGDVYTFSTVNAALAVGTNGQLLSADSTQTTGLKWITASGTGTVTSLNTDSTSSAIFTNTANVIGTTSVTLTFLTQVKNKVFAGPTTGSDAAPSFRLLVGADLPLPAAATLGGVFSKAAVSNNFLTSISSVDGSIGQAQPAFTNLSGSLAGSQLPTFTGDVTNSSAAMTVAKIAGVAVGTPTGTGNVVFSASPTFTGTAVLASATVSGSLKAGNYHIEPSENNAGNSSTAQTIDWSLGSSQLSTLTGNVTYTFSNPVSGGSYVLRVATGAGSFTATWPGTVKWSGGTAPTITVTASKTDLINFYYDGTNYYGSFVQNF